MARKMSAARKAAIEAQEVLHRAQEVFYTVFDAKTAKQRIAIAEKAIAISPLCADAYVLLAEHAGHGSDKSFDLWQRAVEAGKQALGEEFEEFHGAFWGFIETRPYMRARFGLACAMWERGEREDALGHLREMLELNPNDNQGVRYILASWLVETGRDDDLRALLEHFDDDGAASWNWTKALAAFRRDGDTPEARLLLLEAFKANKHVPVYLRGEREMPKSLPPFMSIGGEDEAIHYAAEFAKGWFITKGAVDWLRANLPAGTKKPRRGGAWVMVEPGIKPKSTPKAKATPKAETAPIAKAVSKTQAAVVAKEGVKAKLATRSKAGTSKTEPKTEAKAEPKAESKAKSKSNGKAKAGTTPS